MIPATDGAYFFTYLIVILANAYFIKVVWESDMMNEPSVQWFVVVMAIIIMQGVIGVVRIAVPLAEVKVLLFNVRFVTQWGIVTASVVFSLVYTDRAEMVTRRFWAVILVPPVVFVGLVLTNPWHHIIWTAYNAAPGFGAIVPEPTIVYFVMIGLGYVYVGSTAIIVLVRVFKSRRASRRQQIVLGLSYTATIIAHASQVFNVIGGTSNNLVISATAFTTGAMFALFRGDLFRIKPVGLDTIVEAVSEGIIVVSDSGHIADFNEEAARLFSDLEAGKHIEEAAALLLDDEGGIIESFEIGEGESHRYVVDTRPFQRHGSDSGRVITIQDVTLLEKYEKGFEHQTEQLDEFAGFVSHDLRNPLTVASMYAEDLSREITDDRLNEVKRALDRMDTMIDDALALAREGQAIEEQEFARFDEVVRDSWAMSDTAAATVDVRTGEIDIYCDPSRLQTLLENLFRNSVDHGPTDVTVRVGLLDDGKGFYVEDDGPGIPEDKRDEVLEQGFTTDEKGTGLGLSIVESIATAHGWETVVAEGIDGGARFEFKDVDFREVDDAPTAAATSAG